MRRILFDIISLQGYHNGGEEYTRAILMKLRNIPNIYLMGIYDSSLCFLGNDYDDFRKLMPLFDVNQFKIADIISMQEIDVFFIGIGQRYCKYDLHNINCKVVCTIHDIGDLEIVANKIDFFFPQNLRLTLRIALRYLMPHYHSKLFNKIKRKYASIMDLCTQTNTTLITVSEYSKNAMLYFFPILTRNSIPVFYPPINCPHIYRMVPHDNRLYALIKNKTPYLLLVNANRNNKNADYVLRAFEHIKIQYPRYRLVVTGLPPERSTECIVCFNYLSLIDIELCYKYAWALVYPSYCEGFGYPPLRAMKYGTPVLSSNVCSMPEVLGDSAVYFSPFYEEDLYLKFIYLQDNYDKYSKYSLMKYNEVVAKQAKDCELLIQMLIK